jgi:TetR/AcrR family transcriptional repressor of nem operon
LSRPRSFDGATVLEAALASFWGRGFEATSVRDLSSAMGISGPSLYNAFGGKRELFCAALQHYCRTRTHPLLARLERDHSGGAAVPALFGEIIARSIADGERRGCFLINAALETAPHDVAVDGVVRGHLSAIRTFFLRGLAGLDRKGGHRAGRDPAGDADHLVAVLIGIRVLARTQPEPEMLARTARAALRSVGFSSRQLGGLGAKGRGGGASGRSGKATVGLA